MCSLPDDTPPPECVLEYVSLLQQWADIKEKRAKQELLVIEWLQREERKTMALADGTKLRLVHENIRTPLNKDQLHAGLLFFLRGVLPTLQQELNTSMECLSYAMAQHLWGLRSERHVVKIRQS